MLLRLPACAILLPSLAFPALFFHKNNASERAPAIALRKRVHVNTLITQPDTVEVE